MTDTADATPATQAYRAPMPENVQTKFGRWLMEHKVKMRQAARDLRIDPATVLRWSSGEHTPGLYLGLAIAVYTNGEVGLGDWLTEEEAEMLKAIKPRS